jgi:hypothetical protein
MIALAVVDARAFDDELRRILSAIYNLTPQGGDRWVSAVQVSHHLRDEYGLGLHWKTIDALLSVHRLHVSRQRRSNRWRYMLLASGRNLIQKGGETISFVDPASALEATLKLHDLLAGLKGKVRVCDPYVDEATVEHLGACPAGAKIDLLTTNIKDSGRLKRLVAATNTPSARLEIRVSTNRTLHDRYVIDDSSMLILGASFNGFGKKQSFVVKAGTDVRKIVLADFDQRWASATRW